MDHVIIAEEALEDKLRRIADILGLVDFAFPGSCEMVLEPYSMVDTLTVRVGNVLRRSFDELIYPRLRGSETQDYEFAGDKLVLKFHFDVEHWPHILPVLFLPVTHERLKEATPSHVGNLLRAIADGNVDGRSYQEWISTNMTDKSHES